MVGIITSSSITNNKIKCYNNVIFGVKFNKKKKIIELYHDKKKVFDGWKNVDKKSKFYAFIDFYDMSVIKFLKPQHK
jgi:hypothetical protein